MFSLDGLKPSILATNAEATHQVEGRPVVAADLAAWRAHARYGVHAQWPYVQKGAGEPFHPLFIDCLKERKDVRDALGEDLRRDVMDAVTASDLFGGNLTVVLTTTGRLVPSTEVTAKNIGIDVYVTPRELRHHETAFEEAVSVLTQIFIEKMAIPHCHEFKRRGLRLGFMKDGSQARGTNNVPRRNAWPTHPISYTDASLLTYQTIPGWPTVEIGNKVLSFLSSVFPAVNCPSRALPVQEPDEFDAIVEDDSQWPDVNDVDNAMLRHFAPPATEVQAIQTAAKVTEGAAQDMCRAVARAQADIDSLQAAIARKLSELHSARTRAMQLGLRADEALADHLVYHGFDPRFVETKVAEARALRAALIDPVPIQAHSVLPPTVTPAVASLPHSSTPSRAVRAHTVPPAPSMKHSIEASPSIPGVAQSPRVAQSHKPIPTTPTVPSRIMRTMTPVTPARERAPSPFSDETVSEHGGPSDGMRHVRNQVVMLELDEGVADALDVIMQRFPTDEWAAVMHSRFNYNIADSLLDAMRWDYKDAAANVLDVALSPGVRGKGKERAE